MPLHAVPFDKPTLTHILASRELQITRAIQQGMPEVFYVATMEDPLTTDTLATLRDYVPAEASLNDVEHVRGIWHFEFVNDSDPAVA